MPVQAIDWTNSSAVFLPTYYKDSAFDDDDLNVLVTVYNVWYPDVAISKSNLSSSFRKYGTVTIFGKQFGSKLQYRTRRSTAIFASWTNADGSINQDTIKQTFGLIDFYISQSVVLNGEYKRQLFACVTWYLSTDDTPFTDCNPLCVINKHNMVPPWPSRFLPIQRISTKSSFALINEGHEQRYIASPLLRYFES